ncbi:hypothetical protein KSP40_PGU008502 [Platanthera guangdongensis]|uniref:Phytocyanin domain-containing protein n=1 Tax=Platanthera guangdongensis TaxID=2320717 RepID=A0ABR2MXI4_9ASPA
MNTPLQAYTGGTAVVKLASPGIRYFICGTPGHCAQGMKLQINTVSASTVINPQPTSPVIQTPIISSPPPPPPSPVIPTPTFSSPPPPPPPASPVIPTPTISVPPPLTASPDQGPPPEVAQKKNNGRRQVEAAGVVLAVSLLMALAS